MSDHRARYSVAHPDAPLGTCKHCGRSCDRDRRTHEECRRDHREANDYRGAAYRREGNWQQCVDCRGWFAARQIQRDHPRELVDNGPRDWTVARCVPCHQAKTRAERDRRRGEQQRGSSVKVSDVVRWVVALAFLGAGVVWMLNDPPPAWKPVVDRLMGEEGRRHGPRHHRPAGSGTDLSGLVDFTTGLLPWVVGGLVLGLTAAAVGRWAAGRSRVARDRLFAMLARETHVNPNEARLRVKQWGWGFRVLAASFWYPGGLFNDAPGSPGRAKVEEEISRKVGRPLVFTWEPDRDRVAWRPRRDTDPSTRTMVPAEPPSEVSAKDEKIRARVHSKVAGAVRGQFEIAWGESDAIGPKRFTVTYPATYNDENPETRLALVEAINSKAPGRWKAEWETEEDRVTFVRRPAMPTMIENPVRGDDDTWRLSFGRDESGNDVSWDLRAAPHCLIVGGTGSGKTVTIRSVATDAARYFTVFCVDPKRIELTGLRGWPGVRAVASSTEDMIALVTMVADEMDARYAAIEDGLLDEDDLPPVLLIIDEAREWIDRVNEWWKNNKPRGANGSEHPVVGRFRSMARLGRSGRIHLLVGIQRPDASVIGGEARDNFGFRVALGMLGSPEGARMVFGQSDVARDKTLLELKGRATVMFGTDEPREVQTYYTPNPRKVRGKEEAEHLAALRAAAGQGAVAVTDINADTIAEYARRLAENALAQWTRPKTPAPPSLPASEPVSAPEPAQVPEPEWQTVKLDALRPGLDRILVDRDGTMVEVRFDSACAEDDAAEVEILYTPDGGEQSIAYVEPDERIQRRVPVGVR